MCTCFTSTDAQSDRTERGVARSPHTDTGKMLHTGKYCKQRDITLTDGQSERGVACFCSLRELIVIKEKQRKVVLWNKAGTNSSVIRPVNKVICCNLG